MAVVARYFNDHGVLVKHRVYRDLRAVAFSADWVCLCATHSSTHVHRANHRRMRLGHGFPPSCGVRVALVAVT